VVDAVNVVNAMIMLRPHPSALDALGRWCRGRWGKVYALDEYQDSQEVARGLATQAAAGLEEAVAKQIVS
jgi:hypothetical protein